MIKSLQKYHLFSWLLLLSVSSQLFANKRENPSSLLFATCPQQFSEQTASYHATAQLNNTQGTGLESILFLSETELEKEESTGNEQPVLYITENYRLLKAKWFSLLTDNRPVCQRQQPDRWSVRLFIVYCVYTI